MKYNAVLFDWHGTLYKHGFPPFVRQLVSDLFHSGYRLGIISNSHRYGDARWVRRKLGSEDLAQFFECVVSTGAFLGNTSSGCHKPNPEVYMRVSSFLGVSCDQCLFLGDSYNCDVLAPRMLGMYSIEVDCDQDYTKRLWDALEDSPTHKRLNLITTYLREKDHIQIHMRDLTEPLSLGERILLGTDEFVVTVVDSDFTKKDILSNTDRRISIQVKPVKD